MANSYKILSEQALEFLISCVKNTDFSSIIDDTTITSSNKTWSSLFTKEQLDAMLLEAQAYSDSLVSSLSKLELKKVDSLDEITAPDYVYLYKDPDTSTYVQYLYVDDAPLLVGDMGVDLDDYMLVADATTEFSKKVDVSHGTANANKYLVTDADGNVTIGDGYDDTEIQQKVSDLETSVENIKDGTTTIGNADKLDGYDSGDFITKDGGTISYGSALKFEDDGEGIEYGITWDGGIVIGDMTDGNNAETIITNDIVCKHNLTVEGDITVSSSDNYIDIMANGTMAVNGNTVLHSENFGEYALPLSGGTVTDDIRLNNGTEAVQLIIDRTLSDGTEVYSHMWTTNIGQAALGIYDATNAKDLATMWVDEENILYQQNGVTTNTVIHSGNLTDYTKNMAIYANLNAICTAFGLEAKQYTTEELFLALPNNVNIAFNHYMLSDSVTVTDVPMSYGLVEIVKTSDVNRNAIRFTDMVKGNLYLWHYHESETLAKTWRKVSATAVADVSKTNITFSNETYISNTGSSWYCVKNGVCYVQLDVTCNQSITSGYVYLVGGLPVPIGQCAMSYMPYTYTAGTNYQALTTNVNYSGQLGFLYGHAGCRYIINFSYPVEG